MEWWSVPRRRGRSDDRGDTDDSDRVKPVEQAADSGQAAILVVVMAVVALSTVVVALAALGRHVVTRAAAQTAADAAALASLEGGREAAWELAVANGAVLVSWTAGPGPDTVTVIVEVDGVRATARATDAP